MKGGYLAVDVQGGLIPQDVLSRIAAADRGLPGMRPEDYYLAESERLADAASRRWDYLLGAYRAFREKLVALPESDAATTLTRERWLLILFQELGFGRLTYNHGSLKAADKEFPVSHLWHSVPIHLLGWKTDLDRSVPGVVKRAPQSMLQEFLNLSDDHLWAVLSNGRRLRILRDSTALVGSAYVEFDLEAIFDGELYAEFVLLYTLLHASRFELIAPDEGTPTCADCWLEKWRAFAAETGMRARDQLRDGVKGALEALGTGFLVANPKLRAQVESGKLTAKEFRHELLRLAYQLIFIFVAEDRNALLDPDAQPAVRDRYDNWFSTRRLRKLAVRRAGDRHRDLWKTAVMVIKALGADEGLPELGLPGLGGLFFRTAGAVPELTDEPRPDQLLWCELPNEAFLTAIRSMSTVRDKDGRPRDVDFQHLGADELGSIYESLLELVPYAHSNGHTRFELREKVSGNERKLTGSYYTPTSLIESLLDTALDPVIDEHAASGDPDDLLKITVCDPACGSGHFLVAAARRIAKRYAAMVTGEDEPVPSEVRKAMRKVVAACIYGVDLQPLAAELAKVSLWIESLEPGQPLAFLDSHIKVGNALIGTTPKLIEAGIPEGAFKALEGDDKSVVAELKKVNKQELRGTVGRGSRHDAWGTSLLFDDDEVAGLADALVKKAKSFAEMPVLSVADVREQERRFQEYDSSPELAQERLIADAWCAAFVWRKHPKAPRAITTSTIRALKRGGGLTPEQSVELRKLVDQYQFFHWHLEFPEVFQVKGGEVNLETGWSGGFTCVLGNPPWEKVKLSEKEFFAGRNDAIANAGNKAARDKLIKALAVSEEGRSLYEAFTDAKRRAEGESHFLRASERYPLTARGDVNTYAIFSENNRTVLHARGRLGIIVPTGIATDATTQYFFKDLVLKRSLASLYDFENAKGIFAQVHRSYKFSLLTLTGHRSGVDRADFAFFLHDAAQLGDDGKRFTLTPDEITLLNPNTGTCPVFRARRDAEITLGIYRRVPVLLKEGDPNGNPWGVTFMRMFDMSNDSALFRPSEADGETLETMLADGWKLEGNILVKGNRRLLPLYEAKMLHHYDHRWATYTADGSTSDLSLSDKQDASTVVLPRYWVSEAEVDQGLDDKDWGSDWFLGFRKICRSTDERTNIAFAVRKAGLGDSGNLLLPGRGAPQALLASAISFPLDYVLRQKLGGTNLNFFQFEQLPFCPPESFERSCAWAAETTLEWISARVSELSYTAYDMASFAHDLGDDGPPFIWDEERRSMIRAELDAAFFHLYGVARDDVDYIMDTFPIVKRKDEAKYGEYRTKRLILELYDAMQDAIDGRKPYQTPLDPPPGHGPRHPAR
ncbi:Eco57I restriction-modification methylase domain-containing protein [Sphaerisporangium fuscum]|uniref:Eco57I restriction-modification methylase domain-containing protein n=1 Tax=Sphaerisporangium fuscum TaxID=2835868 RepID=UPI001BDD5277|nr:DNA methyltransferase [Sphaerisporangium fuscum]